MKIACLGECMVEFASTGTDGEFRQGFAGDTYNTCIYLARCLPDAEVSYITAVGDDDLSRKLLARLEAEQIGTQYVSVIKDKSPGLYVIENDASGERTFSYWRNDSAVRYLFNAVSPQELIDQLAGYDLVYLSGISLAVLPKAPLETLIKGLVDANVKIAFDPNYRPALWPSAGQALSAFQNMAQYCDLILTTLDDDQQLIAGATMPSAMTDWATLSKGEVVVKDGANGAAGKSFAGQDTHQVSPEAITPIDTTGAGDAFNAAYMAARISGATIATALAAGNELATKVILHRGAIIPK